MKIKDIIKLLLDNKEYDSFKLYSLEEVNGKFDCKLKRDYNFRGVPSTTYYPSRQSETKQEAVKKVIEFCSRMGYMDGVEA